MEEDELVASRFRLTNGYMLPHEKLMLGTVSPMDDVIVVVDEHLSNPMVLGEYVDNLSDISNREPICRCGSPLVSDGFDIYCPNDQCGLTLLSRLERLGKTPFFQVNPRELQFTDEEHLVFSADPNYAHPFSIILQPRLWGEAVGTLEHVLLHKKPCSISLATFLVEPLFRSFIDCVSSSFVNYENLHFTTIANFYGHMDELTQRRNYESPIQNRLIREFIWSLGIESLQMDVIERLVVYEKSTGWMEDVMVPYAYLLSHPRELHKELGVHPLEARAIGMEFRRRKYEFADIFVHYSTPEAMADVFKDVP